MAAIAAAFHSLARWFAPPARPTRAWRVHRVRLFAAAFSSAVSSLLLLLAYYLTLGLLTTAFAYPATLYPAASWAYRLDLAQFVGTLLRPPIPTPLTWWIGVIVLLLTYIALGVIYAVLLAWTLQRSDVVKGLGFGGALFLGLALTITVANGLHPAILRNALPDTGLLLLGWSPLATLQLLGVHLLYGASLGVLYQRLTR